MWLKNVADAKRISKIELPPLKISKFLSAAPELGCDNPLKYFEPCTRAYTTEMGSGSDGMVQIGFTTEKNVDLLEFFDETDGLWKPVSMGGN